MAKVLIIILPVHGGTTKIGALQTYVTRCRSHVYFLAKEAKKSAGVFFLLFKEGCRALGGEKVSMYYTVADVFCHLIPLVGCFVTLMATKAQSE